MGGSLDEQEKNPWGFYFQNSAHCAEYPRPEKKLSRSVVNFPRNRRQLYPCCDVYCTYSEIVGTPSPQFQSLLPGGRGQGDLTTKVPTVSAQWKAVEGPHARASGGLRECPRGAHAFADEHAAPSERDAPRRPRPAAAAPDERGDPGRNGGAQCTLLSLNALTRYCRINRMHL
jgi:hypothetical protein